MLLLLILLGNMMNFLVDNFWEPNTAGLPAPRAPRSNVLEQNMGKWSILGAPENGLPWRYLGCLLLLSAGLWMLVENAWRLVDACCLFLKTF